MKGPQRRERDASLTFNFICMCSQLPAHIESQRGARGVEEGGMGRNFSNGDECEYVFNGFFHLMFVMHDL